MKKIISCLTIMFICYNLVFQVSAIAPDNDITIAEKIKYDISEGLILDENISQEEQLAIISNSNILSDEQKAQAVDKINFMNRISLQDIQSSVNSTLGQYNCTVAIPYFKKKNYYYCGPATTKQSLHYINGYSPSQDVIANALGTTTAGTDGDRIVVYMNENQSKIYYMAVPPYSVTSMATMIYNGLTNYKTAPILRLAMEEYQGWRYSSQGHFMNASGLYSEGYSTNGALEYEVTDPYIEYRDNTEPDGKYRINAVAVYDSTYNHFAQKFYY